VIVVDQDNYRSLPAHTGMYRAALALAHGELDKTIAHARAALTLAPGDDPLAQSAAGALAGLASWTSGDLAGAYASYAQSVAGLTRAGFLADVLGCTITLGDIRRTQGQLSAAQRAYERALAMTESTEGTDILRGSADMHVGLAGVLTERNDLAAAGQHLATSQELGEHNGLPQNAYRWRVVSARLREAEGDLDEALRLLDEADEVYVGDFAPNVQPVPALRARLHIRRGELSDAQEWADQRQLSAGDAPSYLREYEHLTLARLMLAVARAEVDAHVIGDVSGLLDRLLTAAERGGRAASALEILMLQAEAHDVCGNSAAALAALRRAVVLAQPEGYVRLFADEGASMAALLKALRMQRDAPAYVSQLVAATAKRATRASSSQHLVDPLSERELDVLRMLGGELGGPDIARQLSVSLNTVRSHTKNIYAKLGVSNRREAVREGRKLHLIAGGQQPG
jgi:LuxR family maltose regulon positive regulatory protein